MRERILDIAGRRSVFRAGDIPGGRPPRTELSRMASEGALQRVGRGLYSLPHAEIGEPHSLVEAVHRYPGGVVCLISALRFHGIGTQLPYATWLMRRGRNVASSGGPPVRLVYASGEAFSFGIETHLIEGAEVAVSTPAKTVADCFKYRNKIGIDVAIEALREGWHQQRFNMDELWAAAGACRMKRVMLPYVEMLVQ